MADDLEKTSDYENRYEASKAYLFGLLEKEEDPKKKEKVEKSIAELINFGGDYKPVKKAEGGLLDEGGEVDEESGNDVPIGGTKEGVRDDIPAMLSEGEFVFPEDVTRYHGLEKLMTLRQEAKMGLKKMEAMGQMGNSEEATMPDDLPFTMDDLILVVGEEEEPKKKDDKPIKAQQGTFVPSQQNLANQGIMGTQQSIYQQPNMVQAANPLTVPASSLVPANTAPVGGYTAPTVLAAPATGYSPLYATEPVPTVATEVDEPEFVPDVSSEYKPVKYINPTTGDTMMINEYQGNPVSAVPAGYIRHSEFLEQGGEDTETTDATTGTGVETAQVATGGRSTDDEKRENEKLFSTLKTNTERKRVKEYNKVFNTDNIKNIKDPSNSKFISNDDLIGAYKDQLMAENVGMGLSVFAGPIGLLPRLGRGKLNDALDARFGEDFEDYRDNPEFQELTKDITRGSVLKEEGSALAQGFRDAFAPDFYEKYDAKYDLKEYSKLKGANFAPVQGYIKGEEGNNLTARQQQHFDNAVRDGNRSTADHIEMVARSNAARNEFAKENAEDIKLAQQEGEAGALAMERLKTKVGDKQYNGIRIGVTSVDSIVEYGGGVATAIEDKRAEEGGTFKKAKVVQTVGVAGDKGPVKTASNTAAEEAAAAAAKAQEEARAAAAKARKKERDRNRNKPSTPTRSTQKSLNKKDLAKVKVVKSTGRRGGGGGKAKGGLMEKDK